MTTSPRTPRDALLRVLEKMGDEPRVGYQAIYGNPDSGWAIPEQCVMGVLMGALAEAAPDPAPLDVERLAKALHDYSGWYTDHTGPVCLACTEDAADIAREYATEVQP